MTRNIKILGLLTLFFLTGCQKENHKTPSGIYLSKVVYHQNADQIRHYYYNSQGLLSTREYEFDGLITEKLEYRYENKMIRRIDYYELSGTDNHTLSQKNYFSFDYDMGNLTKSIRYPDIITTNYEYAGDRVVKIIHSPGSYSEYQYDAAGNIVREVLFMDGAEYWKSTYKYDDKTNPFYLVDPIHDQFNRVDFLNYKCPNNLIYKAFIKENNNTISESEFIFEYNSSGLPTLSYELFTSESNGYKRDSINTLLYEYEIW